jgi:hypothetical protein
MLGLFLTIYGRIHELKSNPQQSSTKDVAGEDLQQKNQSSTQELSIPSETDSTYNTLEIGPYLKSSSANEIPAVVENVLHYPSN